jgi:hypothetical protein
MNSSRRVGGRRFVGVAKPCIRKCDRIGWCFTHIRAACRKRDLAAARFSLRGFYRVFCLQAFVRD